MREPGANVSSVIRNWSPILPHPTMLPRARWSSEGASMESTEGTRAERSAFKRQAERSAGGHYLS
jgi:hypothetical protein